jgi:hypothetical protein
MPLTGGRLQPDGGGAEETLPAIPPSAPSPPPAPPAIPSPPPQSPASESVSIPKAGQPLIGVGDGTVVTARPVLQPVQPAPAQREPNPSPRPTPGQDVIDIGVGPTAPTLLNLDTDAFVPSGVEDTERLRRSERDACPPSYSAAPATAAGNPAPRRPRHQHRQPEPRRALPNHQRLRPVLHPRTSTRTGSSHT